MRNSLLFILCLLIFAFIFGHEDHQGMGRNQPTKEGVYTAQDEQLGGRPQSWMQWIGGFHFIFLHFPIALIVMTAVSELLFAWYEKPIFDYASSFMLIGAAVLAIPTAIFGLIYSYTASYEGLLADFVWWHMWFGISTAIFAAFVALIRYRFGLTKLYYTCLVVLFVAVNITAFLGGGMTFGPYHMLPPSF